VRKRPELSHASSAAHLQTGSQPVESSPPRSPPPPFRPPLARDGLVAFPGKAGVICTHRRGLGLESLACGPRGEACDLSRSLCDLHELGPRAAPGRPHKHAPQLAPSPTPTSAG
jgi:hypothetical protein